MIYLLIFMIAVIAHRIFIKKDFCHPIIYFYMFWALSILFNLIDLYGSRIKISSTTNLVICLGMIAYYIGATLPVNIKITNKNGSRSSVLQYNKLFVYIIITIALIFNIFMAITTLYFMRNGYAYSQIRDLLFSYSGADTSFFVSTFFSTFNSWISSPCVYVIAAIFIIDFFEKKFKPSVRIVMGIIIALYTFATGGRLLILLMLVQAFYLMQVYKFVIPKKYLKKIIKFAIILLLILGLISIFRRKEITTSKINVNTLYSYFSINIPILSDCIQNLDNNDIYGYGLGFIDGFVQPIMFILRKIGIEPQYYITLSETLNWSQSHWLQIYDGYWYNAFCSGLYYFYVDFREVGVFLGSFVFGFTCKCMYKKAIIRNYKKWLPAYMIMLDVIMSFFIRWQFATTTFVVAFIFAFFCVKNKA